MVRDTAAICSSEGTSAVIRATSPVAPEHSRVDVVFQGLLNSTALRLSASPDCLYPEGVISQSPGFDVLIEPWVQVAK